MSRSSSEVADNVGLFDHELAEIERTAVELARVAGAEIQTAFGGMLAGKYKDLPGAAMTWREPVSEVDSKVDSLIRARLKEQFSDHDIIGEEFDKRPGRDHDIVWAIDPVDGTANFVNGFPLFAASIGVLHRGAPIVGALWCATSHALRSGVYHARRGAPLCFEGEPIDPKPNPAVRRRLGGAPHGGATAPSWWEWRITGSAALECAFVASGILRLASFERPTFGTSQVASL
jgi:myo-inositol-1(or 4)-monophosphatase